ncbi:heterokaryon incompatibility protein 6, OR allele [Trichoderma asperellum]|uniref:Heterokaryon incompatibility protein 6, OR allele n=1 Tax=Trichoderma asperellum TaxID=101201 RepID=A0A6V8QYH0_TRIAP|nr:heterokaryon incompatibility protein 6, OR allele [Trichoderma asperellum]
MTALRKRRTPSTASSQPNYIKRAKKSAQFHHYQSLKHLRQEIRLLQLLPGKPGSRIAIKLLTVSLNDNPEYEALSYCWGPPQPSYDIFIHINSSENNEHQPTESIFSFPVGRNLRKALDDLRHQDRPRLIWNDAICINQKDNVEKGHQIQLMHQIYTRAKVVCAWIDHNVQPKTSVFDDLENLGKGVELDDFYDPSYWYPVADIFRNEYWRRLWIQQELILAAKVDVYCRRDVFSGEQLLEFQQKVNVVKSQRTRLGGPEFVLSRYIDGNTSAEPTPEIFGGGVIQARINMREGREAQEAYSISLSSSSSSSSPPSPTSGSQSPSPTNGFKITRGLLASSLLNLFLQSSSVRMTNPRDRLYGILGLATDISHGPGVEVNYDASPVWVYAQVFRHFIHRYKSLSFLCFNKSNPRGSYTSRKGFPSWMPHSDVCWSSVNASRACGAMLATPHIVSIDLETLCLHAQGIKVDTIKHIDLINGDGRGWTPIPAWLDQMESFCRKTWPDADSSSSPLYERDDVTSLMFPWLSPKRYKNMWKLDKPDPARRVHLIRSLLAAARKADQTDLSTGDIIRGGYTPMNIIPMDVREESHPLHVEINAVVLFGTEGSRVGSMARTSDIRVGDEIWILFGCRMPIMMRPKNVEGKGLRYQVIGPAVVPGIMKGEVVKDTGEPVDHGTTIILE